MRGISKQSLEFELDLDAISDKTMTISQLSDIVKRNRYYLKCRTISGLTQSAWCTAMVISEKADQAYVDRSIPVPNSVVNRAKLVSKRVSNLIKRISEI